MPTRKIEEMVLAVCRKHKEVRRAGLAARRRRRRSERRSALAHAPPCPASSPAPPRCPLPEQGVQDKVLESELPDVPVNDRALAINALLAALKLQILVNPADPTSHIYKATQGDTAR